MVTYHEITPTGLANLKQEVEDLKTIRPAKIKNLADAAALGDRSENAEYSAAKRELRQLEGRLRYLDKLIRYAKVTHPAASDIADIAIGSHLSSMMTKTKRLMNLSALPKLGWAKTSLPSILPWAPLFGSTTQVIPSR